MPGVSSRLLSPHHRNLGWCLIQAAPELALKVVHCARTAAENGKCEPMVAGYLDVAGCIQVVLDSAASVEVGQLVGEFLKNTART